MSSQDRGPVHAGDVSASVSSEEAAEQLRGDFADLVTRVNMDLVNLRLNPRDPVSVEMAVAQAERSVDYHLETSFQDKAVLRSLVPQIKEKFRQGIEAQATVS